MKILIYGAGSIGNHYANGFIERSHEVFVTDISREALQRMKTDIYPSRYKHWNDSIKLIDSSQSDELFVDVILIGTPPESHLDICLNSIVRNKPKIIHIEKPVSTINLTKIDELKKLAAKNKTILLNGYNHNLTNNVLKAREVIKSNDFGKPLVMHSNVNEHWGGIFKAHPWIKNLKDTYLSNYELGGGAMSEHSHGINLWQTFSDILGMGKITSLASKLIFEETKEYKYDSIMQLNVCSEKGLIGNITQDVVTKPPQKNLEIIFEKGHLKISNNFRDNLDRIEYNIKDKNEIIDFPKTRKDDFLGAIFNIEKTFLNNKNNESSMDFDKAVDTIYIIKSAILSNNLNKRVNVSYS